MTRKLRWLMLCLWFPALAIAGRLSLVADTGGTLPPDTVNILQFRALPTGTTATFSGWVTRARGEYVFMEDGSAGITVHQTSGSFFDSVATGYIAEKALLRITGRLSSVNQMLMVEQTPEANNLDQWEVFAYLPEPAKPMLIPAGMVNMHGEMFESRLVTVSNLKFTNETDPVFLPGTSYTAWENGDMRFPWVEIHIEQAVNSALVDAPLPAGLFSVTGILAQHHESDGSAGYLIFPVKLSDIWEVEPADGFRDVVFNVNMNPAISTGRFKPDSHYVYVRGTFNNFALGHILTDGDNDTAQTEADKDGIFSVTISIPGRQFDPIEYKFFADAPQLGWEGNVGPGGENGNRVVTLGPPDMLQVLDPVPFNNEMIHPDSRTVYFTLNMNVMIAEDYFHPERGDEVVIYGDFTNWDYDPAFRMNPVENEPGLFQLRHMIAGPENAVFQYRYRIHTGDGRWIQNDGWEQLEYNMPAKTSIPPNYSYRHLVVGPPGLDIRLDPVYFGNRTFTRAPLFMIRVPTNTDIAEKGEAIHMEVFAGNSSRWVKDLYGLGMRIHARPPLKFTGASLQNLYGNPMPWANALEFVTLAPDSSWIDISRVLVGGQQSGDYYWLFSDVYLTVTDTLYYWERYPLWFENVLAINHLGQPINLEITNGYQFRPLGPEIWPGDTDISGWVDQRDVLPLGQYYGMNGPMRENPFDISWRGVQAQPWMEYRATHADAVGDGVVNQNDLLPVGLNFGKYRVNEQPQTKAEPALASAPATGIRAGDKVRLTITSQTAALPELRILGGAFGLRIPEGLNLKMSTESEWFAHPDMLRFNNLDAATRLLGIATTRRLAHGSVTLQGQMLTLEFDATRTLDAATFELISAMVSTENLLKKDIPFEISATVVHTNAAESDRVYSYALHQNYPNPFNPSTTVTFDLEKAGTIRLSIYNVVGQEVAVLVNEIRSAGEHSVTFDASKLASGLYFYKLNAGGFQAIRKMTLVK